MVIVIKRAQISDAKKRQLALLSAQHAVLLMGDGVYLAPHLPELRCRCYIYSLDATVRGIRNYEQQLADDTMLVTLAHTHSPWVVW